MAVFNEPTQWEHPLGNNADTSTLPDDAVATAGIASLQKLFQIINATPLEAGGIAPDREDVNALFKLLGDSIFYAMTGGVPSYNADYDYIAGRVVSYNGNIYKCIQANGVSSTVVTPDSGNEYWQRLDNCVRSVNGVNADNAGNVNINTVEVESMLLGSKGYIRYKDGLQLCWDSNFSTDSLLTMNTTVNFIKPFYDTNYALIGPDFGIINKGRQHVTNKTTTSFTTTSHTEATGTNYYLAIGRWK